MEKMFQTRFFIIVDILSYKSANIVKKIGIAT